MKHLFTFFAAIALFAVFSPMALSQIHYDFSAVAPSGQTLYYNIVDGNAEVTYPSYNGVYDSELELHEYYYYDFPTPVGDLVIPSTVTYNGTTYSVTTIGRHAFYECTGLNSVAIPNSVSTIGYCALARCTGLTSITIPNSVTSIGDHAFSGCTGLSTVNFNATNCTSMDYVFNSCTSLTTINIGDNVQTIPYIAFSGCTGLTSISIPNSVTYIGQYAFSGCTGLTSLNIPNSVTSIGTNPFSGCIGLTEIVVESGNTVYDSRNNCNAIIETATNTLIAGCKNTTVPNTVISIGYYAFRGCTGLTSFTIPNSVTSIGGSAFSGCTGLTSLTIPNSVTSIEEYTFAECSNLRSVDIASSVTSIGHDAFGGCSGLTDVHMRSLAPPTLGSKYVFRNMPGTCLIYIPCGRTAQYSAAQYWSELQSHFIEDCNNNAIDNPENSDTPVHVYSENGRIHVTVAGQSPDNFAVYDVMGRRVFQASNADETQTLPAGLYMVKVANLKTQKVVVR